MTLLRSWVLVLSSGSSKKRVCLDNLEVDFYVDYKSPDLVNEVKGVTNGGPYAAIIVSPYIRPGGSVVTVGLPPGQMSTNIFAMVTQKVNIKGSFVGNRYETEEALRIMANSGFQLQSKVVDFADLTKVYGMMEKGLHLDLADIHSHH
ncbi:unnamed protein product [Clonostachys solani]|uniref:Alcohol dehydrogenase-like C-terminal domain-containing protein n=1 Tax=Clonostachys solani TaxID=160281 RepID=A0A9N9ZHW3_9HYPO|nr:unnamed protein product [Clonostachys solani]